MVQAWFKLCPGCGAEGGTDGADCREESVVNGSAIIEVVADDLLAVTFFVLGEMGICLEGFCILNRLAVFGWCPWVG